MKRDKRKLTEVSAEKPTIFAGVFADDDAKAEAHKKVSEVLGGTLIVTCQDGVEVWTVRKTPTN